MSDNFRDIHLGSLISTRVTELEIEMSRICSFFKCTEEEVLELYQQENIMSNILLQWSKLLEYDFFRIYSHHLILYSPVRAANSDLLNKKKKTLPEFRKNVYTKEIIDFILNLVNTGEKTKTQVINEYRIPKTTLYKWIDKYSKHKYNIKGNK